MLAAIPPPPCRFIEPIAYNALQPPNLHLAQQQLRLARQAAQPGTPYTPLTSPSALAWVGGVAQTSARTYLPSAGPSAPPPPPPQNGLTTAGDR